MRELYTRIDPRYALDGFRQFVEDDVNSLKPKASKKHHDGAKDDYLGSLEDELGFDWKSGVKKDKLVIQEPIEVGHYVYKTSAWTVVDADEDHVTIQLDPAGAPNLSHNVFRKKHNGELERVGPDGPFDTEPKTIPRKQFAHMLDAALRAAQQGGGAGGAPGGMPPPPGGAPPGMPPM
jgi:hypothetical protein